MRNMYSMQTIHRYNVEEINFNRNFSWKKSTKIPFSASVFWCIFKTIQVFFSHCIILMLCGETCINFLASHQTMDIFQHFAVPLESKILVMYDTRREQLSLICVNMRKEFVVFSHPFPIILEAGRKTFFYVQSWPMNLFISYLNAIVLN